MKRQSRAISKRPITNERKLAKKMAPGNRDTGIPAQRVAFGGGQAGRDGKLTRSLLPPGLCSGGSSIAATIDLQASSKRPLLAPFPLFLDQTDLPRLKHLNDVYILVPIY